MLKNYFRSIARLLHRQKGYAVISAFSLVMGMTCFILLTVFVRYELGDDSFRPNAGRIYKVGQVVPSWVVRGSNRFDSTSGPLGPALEREFPEVEHAVRTFPTSVPLVCGEKRTMARGLFTERSIFAMLSLPLTAGNPDTALGEPYTIVLTDRLAATIFGNTDPMGRTIRHENGREYRVTGVVAASRPDSHFRFDNLLSFSTIGLLRDDLETSWSILNYRPRPSSFPPSGSSD